MRVKAWMLSIPQLFRFIRKISLRKWLLLVKRRSLDILRSLFAKLLMGNKQLEERQEILLQNRELSLLNELSGQVRSIPEMQAMLEQFLKRAVSDLQLPSAVIQINVVGEY